MTPVVFLVCGLVLADAPPAADAPKAADLAAYEAARAAAAPGSAAQVDLALWCESHGLRPEALRHLARAVLGDPTDARARGLMGLVAFRGQWKRPDAVAEKVKADAALTAALAEYNGLRARTPETADAQYKLAQWCERNGLDVEARAHYGVVTRLDPAREAAWKKLGCKKVHGRWTTDDRLAAEKAEADAQKKADHAWKPLLTRLRDALDAKDRGKRDDAAAKLAEVIDPRAVPSVWAVFVRGGRGWHATAVAVLSRIDAADSSRALAWLAVTDDDPEVRRTAAESLKRRDPREFADVLVRLIRDPIKYEVRPVGGPGSPGALFVQGKAFNVQRLYSPPAVPQVALLPGDRLVADGDGLPVIARPGGVLHLDGTGRITGQALLDATQGGAFDTTKSPDWDRAIRAIGSPANGAQGAAAASALTRAARSPTTFGNTLRSEIARASKAERRNPSQIGFALGSDTYTEYQIPVGRMVIEAQKAAVSAAQQLDADAAYLDAYNDGLGVLNGRSIGVLAAVAGKDLGRTQEPWKSWWVDQLGYASKTTQDAPLPTFVENVPLDYRPQGTAVTESGFSTPSFRRMSCFGAGTLVRTLEGSRAIETLQVGDRVLTQDVRSGALNYHPVSAVHHNPPSPTFVVNVAGDAVVSSPFHRFWVVGKGWVMARDLKIGDTLRRLDGPARVDSVTEGPVQPVFNLDVADDHDFFAGAGAALVHDNSLPDTRLAPFDAAPEIAALGKAGR